MWTRDYNVTDNLEVHSSIERPKFEQLVNTYTTNKIIEEWNIIHETLHSATLVEQDHSDKVKNERIKALNHRKDKND